MFDQSEQPGGLDIGALYESRLTLLERADQAGFWGYHKSEHHMIPLDHAPNIGIFLGAAAQRTSNIRLCSLVHLLPFQHPIRLIEDVCMLDHLTGGRFEFGFGKGISAPEHMLWGIDPEEAVAKTEEMLALLLAGLTCDDELFSFEGEFWQLTDVPLELRPKQRPYPPLWRPGTVSTAAALGVSTLAGGPIEKIKQSVETYRAELQPGIGGGHPATIGAITKFIIAPTEAEADQIGRRAWPVYSHNLGKLFHKYDMAIPNDPTLGGDYELAKTVRAAVVGTPTQVRDHVEQLRDEAGIDYVVGAFSFGDLSHDESLRSLELFAEHVVQPLKDQPLADQP